MVRTHAPGFDRIMLGNFELIAINDETVRSTWKSCWRSQNDDQTRTETVLPDHSVRNIFYTFLIGAGAQPVLIDTGGGVLVGPSLCKLLISLPPKIFGEAASDRALLGADHMQFAGLGHLRSNGAAWT